MLSVLRELVGQKIRPTRAGIVCSLVSIKQIAEDGSGIGICVSPKVEGGRVRAGAIVSETVTLSGSNMGKGQRGIAAAVWDTGVLKVQCISGYAQRQLIDIPDCERGVGV